MTKKMKKESGFTLVEMLIVVAIIAILIAVSIPLVTNALEKAREATDAANERSFKAVLTIQYLSEDVDKGEVYVYDAVNGVADKSMPDAAYSQSNTVNKGNVLIGKIDSNGKVTMGWVALKTGEVSNTENIPNNLISDKLIGTKPDTTS